MPNVDASLSSRTHSPERMWPLDFSLVALGGLVFYTVVSEFRFDDPRPMYNAWTYVLVVPAATIFLSLLIRSVASRFIEKSIQLGFLISVFVHLSLLMMAVNVIIFSRYFPEAFNGSEPRRTPVRKTIPDYLFAAPTSDVSPPDWSTPIETETASIVEPVQPRELPPVQRSAMQLEMPVETIEIPVEPDQAVIPRPIAESAMPTPANEPGKRAKAVAQSDNQAPPIDASTPIATPNEISAAAAGQDAVAREITAAGRAIEMASATMAASPMPTVTELEPLSTRVAGGARAADIDRLPTIGNIGESTDRIKPQQRELSASAAGAAPAPVSVAIAAIDASAERTASPIDMTQPRESSAIGASLTDDSSGQPSPVNLPGIVSGAPTRSSLAMSSGMPSVDGGAGNESTSRTKRNTAGLPIPAGGATNIAATMLGDLGSGWAATSRDDTFSDGSTIRPPSPDGTELARDSLVQPRANLGGPSAGASAAMEIDMTLGVGGLADISAIRPGVSLTDIPEPRIETMSLMPSDRRRANVGGPVAPAGTEIAAIESFKRRTMRTQSGSKPSPIGQVEPATEEAIERGLAFLAARQKNDGGWSLQGHGEDVILQSDTAATGLCLLAFQGAGYTHQQHQYAPVVLQGLQSLLTSQQKDGNLYRAENRYSDQNVGFYSHGIAALALCEAYGMTQDENLKIPAQKAVDYIVLTQNKQLGAWRYQPQVSSDTSVSGWMMMALKSGELAGLNVPQKTYDGIDKWLDAAQASPDRADRYRYNPYALDTPSQRHGKDVTPTMTAVGILMRMYAGWSRDDEELKSAAEYLAKFPPAIGDASSPQRDTYYWYYATQVMYHMGGNVWKNWNERLNPILIDAQIKTGPQEGSWDPKTPVPDRWSAHAGRLYLTTMNLLSLEVYYRHLPIYDDVAK